jgi:two-component system sensor kinase FixL
VTVKRSAAEIMVSLTTTHSYRGWRGYGLAVASVIACFALRSALEIFGQFYYLPMVPAVLITAMLAHRAHTALAILLCVMVNVVLVPREGMVDTIVNAGLFVVEGWFIGEICWAQRRLHRRSISLARSLTGRNALLDTVLATVPVVILDRSGDVRRLTPAASSLLGVSSQSVAGRPLGDLIQGFDLSQMVDKASSGPLKAPSGQWTARRPDGAPLLLSLQLGVTPDATDGDYAAVCLTDLTEVEVATARARDLDVQLNRVWRLNSLGEMAATLAHELNQPLSAAATYMHASQRDIEKAGLLGQSASRTLDLAKAQVIRAGKIIRRMRELLAADSRSLEEERISSMIEDLSQAFALIGRERGVEIRTDISGTDDIVRSERIQFQQAMINLVRNAVDAVSDRPDPVVLITGRSMGDAGYHVTVEDNGPGIAEDRVEDIFQPMTTTKSTGMGLGLLVTRKIVESHGGSLVVRQSNLGGAAFAVELPREVETV